MYSLNKIELIGRVGTDELKVAKTSKDQAVLTISIATNEKWVSEDGTEQEHVEWHRCVFYRKSAEYAAKLLSKGALVFVSGKITYRKYTDNSGNQRYCTEIIVSDFMILNNSHSALNNIEAQASTIKQDENPAKSDEAAEIYSIGDFDGNYNL